MNGDYMDDSGATYYDPYQPPVAPQAPPFFTPTSPGWTGQSLENANVAQASGAQIPNVPIFAPGAQPGATQGAQPSYGGAKDFKSLVRYWQQNHPATAPDLPGLISFLNQNGVQASNATHNGMQSDDKLLVNGQTFDLGSSLGGPGASWFSDFGPMGEGDGQFAIDPSYLAPYTQQFQAPSDSALPQFQGPGAFKLPSKDDILKDPSYLWREGRITDQVQNSASAAGTLNSSGTLDRLMGSIGDFASQEYGNIVNRDFGVWNQDWQHALSAYDAQTGRANTAYNRGVSEYDMGKQLFYDSQDRPYNKLSAGVDLGSRAAMA